MKTTLSIVISLVCLFAVNGQSQPTSAFAAESAARYWVQPDIVYGSANNTALKLDVWYQNDVKTPQPTLVYIHGGGWIFGNKET
ncbi:MAG: alpha/beta hydrolase, partial [Pyrinomonadaceae bacterium]|nr:alpha/beta hydrolase [Pyrinomonadaceae bacterium]